MAVTLHTRQAFALIALLTTGIAPAQALTLGPLRMAASRGIFQISNSEPRLIRLSLGVYGVNGTKGARSPSTQPLPLAEAESMVRIRPISFRLGPGQSRLVSYRVLHPSRSFYICGVSPSGLYTLRVCSLWPGSDRVSSLPVPVI